MTRHPGPSVRGSAGPGGPPGLVRSQRKSIVRDSVRGYPTIEKTTGVCGRRGRISGTRIPVWQLVAAREAGASEGQLLLDFPRLEARNLVDAWAYATDHPEEIRGADSRERGGLTNHGRPSMRTRTSDFRW